MIVCDNSILRASRSLDRVCRVCLRPASTGNALSYPFGAIDFSAGSTLGARVHRLACAVKVLEMPVRTAKP